MCNSNDSAVDAHYYWKNSDGEATMPWLVPHGSDEDALYHHVCAQYSGVQRLSCPPHGPGLFAGEFSPAVAQARRESPRSCRFVQRPLRRRGSTRHMSVAYAARDSGETYCMFDPADLGCDFENNRPNPKRNPTPKIVTRSPKKVVRTLRY